MEQHEFEIEISKSGDVKVRIRGAKGQRCLDYVEFLKQVVGPVRSMQPTGDSYDPDVKARIESENALRARRT